MRYVILAVTLVSAAAAAQHHERPRIESRPEAGGPFAVGQPFLPELRLRSWVRGWALTGAEQYQLRCDDTFADCAVPILRSTGRVSGDAHGSLTHTESAVRWRGAQLELRAELRAGWVSGKAGLWVTAEAADGTVLARAEMEGGPLIGTSSFQWRRVTLTVPKEAERVSFGVGLTGAGAVFIRELKLDEAPTEVATVE